MHFFVAFSSKVTEQQHKLPLSNQKNVICKLMLLQQHQPTRLRSLSYLLCRRVGIRPTTHRLNTCCSFSVLNFCYASQIAQGLMLQFHRSQYGRKHSLIRQESNMNKSISYFFIDALSLNQLLISFSGITFVFHIFF